jgi:hypothetical protein
VRDVPVWDFVGTTRDVRASNLCRCNARDVQLRLECREV